MGHATEAFGSRLEAARWFRQAALQGNVEAQFHLARLVAKGAKGLKQDLGTALKLYQDAAGKGHPQAMNALGQAYQQGTGTEQDLAKAAEWQKQALAARDRVKQKEREEAARKNPLEAI